MNKNLLNYNVSCNNTYNLNWVDKLLENYIQNMEFVLQLYTISKYVIYK